MIHMLSNTIYVFKILIEIDGIVSFNDYIRPACLSHSMPKLGDRVFHIGWYSASTSRNDQPLRKLRQNIVSNTICYDIFKTSTLLEK